MPAAKHRWDELAIVRAQSQDAVADADVAILQAFSWLVDAAQQATLRKTGAIIVAQKSGDVSAGPASNKKKRML